MPLIRRAIPPNSAQYSGLRDDDAKGERTSYTVDTAEQRELRRLRLENDYLRQQRDLYRKACGIIFVEEEQFRKGERR